MNPVSVGDTIWINNPDPFSRVPGWPRTVMDQGEADAVNAAIAAGVAPFLPDVYTGG